MYHQLSLSGKPLSRAAGLLTSLAFWTSIVSSVAVAEDKHERIFPRAMVAPPNLKIPATLGTHDPSRIIYDNGAYYFYSTSPNLSGTYTTDNGNTWKGTGQVFPGGIPKNVHDAVPTNDGSSIWAPDVIWNPNTNLFHIYYAVADWNDDTRSAIGLVTSPTLNPSKAVWTNRGVVIAKTPTANTYNAIDPGPFFDFQGNMWLSLGSGYASTRSTALNVIALDKNTGLRSDSSVHVLHSCGCEASYIQPHGGYYYLFWNTGGCCSGAASTYLIHVARSTSVTGPYTGDATFLASSTHVHGPGQIGIITLGNTDYFSYHYYPDSGGSVLGIGAISWTNGWPSPNGVANGGGGSGGGSSGGGGGTTAQTTASATKTTAKTTTTAAAGGGGGSGGQQAQYGQCGGIGWTGPTACVSPFKCQYSNDYYSQCL